MTDAVVERTGAATANELHPIAPAGEISLADEVRVLGGVLWLCRFSRLHSGYLVAQLNERIGPSLPRRQFLYFADGSGTPMAFCNWAWLTPTVLEEVIRSGRDVKTEEWNCGELPFFTEFIAPFGHARKVVRALRELGYFKGRNVPVRGDPVRQGLRVHYLRF